MAAYLFANVIFSAIGFVALYYAKKQGLWKTALIGVLLMCYPYFISGTILLYVIGIALTACLFVFRD